jgi:hypothetical protein
LVSPYDGAKLSDVPVESAATMLRRDDKLFAADGGDKVVTLRRATDGVVVGVAKVGDEITDKNTFLEGVRVSSDGNWLGAYDGYHGQTFVWSLVDISNPRLIRSLPTTHYVFLPDNRVAYSDRDAPTDQGRVAVIDLRTGSVIGCLVAPRGNTDDGMAQVTTTPSGRWLAAALYSSTYVYVWDLKTLSQ